MIVLHSVFVQVPFSDEIWTVGDQGFYHPEERIEANKHGSARYKSVDVVRVEKQENPS
jgi:hypothetical protein